MAIVKTPAKPYALAEWLKKPFGATNGDLFDKYNYKNGESLASIATVVSKNGRTITWQELTNFNWGTAVPSEINFYLRDHTGCKHETRDGNNYYFASDDINPFVWVPRAKTEPQTGKYRSPGKKDVGHVALDDESKKHINTLVIKPVYLVSLELGDIDALYDADAAGKPTDLGRQQRLQALGYLYTPLKHTQIGDAFKKCWSYYKDVVHTTPKDGLRTDAEWDAMLISEMRNNVVARSFPRSGTILGKAELPRPGEFAAIRIPGGYTYSYPPVGKKATGYQYGDAPTGADAKYQIKFSGDRHVVEKLVRDDNDLIGAIPLVATVHKLGMDGKKVPAEGVTVYFQLVMPDELKTGNAFRAPDLRNTEMDYSKNFKTDAAPFEVTPAGPRKFVDDILKANKSADDKDPQKDNCDSKFGGKRGKPVPGNVFEVGKTRPGLHTKRSDKHADYGKMSAAQAATPDGDDHKHAVKARTNDKGHACVLFTPSQCGGDTYKIRAYVGPESLEFNGADPEGPMVETGTFVVWRNIRLYRYIRMDIPPLAGASQAVKDLWTNNSNSTTNTVAKAYTDCSLDGTTMGAINVGASAEGYDNYAPQDPAGLTGGVAHKAYRPVQVQFIGLEEQFRRCWCEFINDCKVTGEKLGSFEHGEALKAGRKAAGDSGEVDQVVDWDTLIPHDATSPWLINIRDPNHYNTLIASAPAPAPPRLQNKHIAQIARAVEYHMLAGMMEYLSGGGVLPGLTIVHVPRGETWEKMGWSNALMTSGVGLACRGCFLAYSNKTYTRNTWIYSLTANAAHEVGHVLVRQHQSPVPGGADLLVHEPQTGNGSAPAGTCVCVMSYKGCYGQYCGRCVLAFRGWQTLSATLATGA